MMASTARAAPSTSADTAGEGLWLGRLRRSEMRPQRIVRRQAAQRMMQMMHGRRRRGLLCEAVSGEA
jgi:hypothetical protein